MDEPPTPPPRNDPHPHPRAFQPAHGAGTSRIAITIAAAILLAIGAGLWYWWQQRSILPPLGQAPETTPAPVAAAAPSAAAAPAIQHPIDDAPQAAASAPAPLTLDTADPVLRNALIELLGSPTVTSMLRTDDFARHFVATIDNLGRAHAAPRLWPVAPTPGRFSVQAAGGDEQIAATNAARYDAFVAMVTTVDTKRAGALYRRFYPLFQRAYQELGYPNAYFNDRAVAVIDQLLATPEPSTPPTVRLTEVKGEVASTQPWTRYEFTDPALQALPAGSKALLRMGPQHASRLKAQLRALRAEIARK